MIKTKKGHKNLVYSISEYDMGEINVNFYENNNVWSCVLRNIKISLCSLWLKKSLNLGNRMLLNMLRLAITGLLKRGGFKTHSLVC